MRVSKVKLSLLVFSFCIVMGSITGNVQANPPRDIVPEFDSSTKILKIEVVHPVRSVESHFVKKLEIFLDGKLMVVQNFNSQSSKKTQEVFYVLIDALAGSEIVIQAECSIYGSLKKKMTLE